MEGEVWFSRAKEDARGDLLKPTIHNLPKTWLQRRGQDVTGRVQRCGLFATLFFAVVIRQAVARNGHSSVTESPVARLHGGTNSPPPLRDGQCTMQCAVNTK